MAYWAKRRKVSKLVRDTEQDILIDYNVAAANLTANSNANLPLKSTNPVTTSSECLLGLPTTSDLPLNRPLISDHNENITSTSSKASPNVQFESIVEDDDIESESKNGSDSEENSEDVLMTSLKYWATNYSVSLVALSTVFLFYLYTFIFVVAALWLCRAVWGKSVYGLESSLGSCSHFSPSPRWMLRCCTQLHSSQMVGQQSFLRAGLKPKKR